MLWFKEKSSFLEYIGSLDLICDRIWGQYTKLRQISDTRPDEAKPLLLQTCSLTLKEHMMGMSKLHSWIRKCHSQDFIHSPGGIVSHCKNISKCLLLLCVIWLSLKPPQFVSHLPFISWATLPTIAALATVYRQRLLTLPALTWSGLAPKESSTKPEQLLFQHNCNRCLRDKSVNKNLPKPHWDGQNFAPQKFSSFSCTYSVSLCSAHKQRCFIAKIWTMVLAYWLLKCDRWWQPCKDRNICTPQYLLPALKYSNTKIQHSEEKQSIQAEQFTISKHSLKKYPSWGTAHYERDPRWKSSWKTAAHGRHAHWRNSFRTVSCGKDPMLEQGRV